MISEREKYEQFENYLKGILDENAKKAFENRLNQDGALKSEFEAYHQAHRLVFDAALLDIRKELEAVHVARTSRVQRRRNIRNYVIPAGIFITAFLSYLLLTRNSAPVSDKPENRVILQTPENKTAQIDDDDLADQLRQPSGIVRLREKIMEGKAGGLSADKSPESLTDKSMLSENPESGTFKRPVEAITDIRALPVTVAVKTDSNKPSVSNPPIHGNNQSQSAEGCDQVVLSSDFTVENTCKDASQGRIIFLISTMQGGQPPYRFSIDDGKSYDENAVFNGISAGRYDLRVKDANNCSATIGIASVQAVECDFRFAPGLGEVWDIPFATDKTGILNLFTRDGKRVYSSAVGPAIRHTWEGMSQNNESLPLGVYLYQLEFNDGSVYNGTVTIIK